MHSSWYGMVREMIECWCGNLTNWHKGCICRNYSGQGIFFCPCSFWTYIVFVVNGIPDLGQTTIPRTASTTPYVYRLCSLTAHRMLWDCVYYFFSAYPNKTESLSIYSWNEKKDFLSSAQWKEIDAQGYPLSLSMWKGQLFRDKLWRFFHRSLYEGNVFGTIIRNKPQGCDIYPTDLILPRELCGL